MRTHIGQLLMGRIQTQLDKQNGKGFSKYKETLDDCEFEEYVWNIMVIEELIDGLQYMIKENLHLKEQLRSEQAGKAKVNFKIFLEEVRRTTPKGDGFTITDKLLKSNASMGLNGEAGEMSEVVKKNIHDGHEFNRDKFIEEGGDTLFYLTWLCDLYDVTLDEIATHNILKRKKRYPNGYSVKESIERRDVGYTSEEQERLNKLDVTV